MAMETWTPPNTGGGFGPNINAKPPGKGWTITGYNTKRVQANLPKWGSPYKTVNIPIYTRMAAAPKPPAPAAAAPAPPPPAAPTAPAPSLESEKYRAEAQSYMQQADAMLKKFQIDQSNAAAAAAAQRAKDEEAVKLREQMFIQSQTTAAANMARAGKTPNLQIQPASGTPEMAGTQGFRRRKQQFNQLSSGGLSALNIQTPSTLNV